MKNPLTELASEQGAMDEHKTRLGHEYNPPSPRVHYGTRAGGLHE